MTTEEYDPRNARASDPETSHLGTAGINHGHLDILVAFLRGSDRLEGWTTGEIRDSSIGLNHPNIWRRVSDGHREGLIVVVRDDDGREVTRVDPVTRRAQRAHRAAGLVLASTTVAFDPPVQL